jgi:hypothetical protein
MKKTSTNIFHLHQIIYNFLNSHDMWCYVKIFIFIYFYFYLLKYYYIPLYNSLYRKKIKTLIILIRKKNYLFISLDIKQNLIISNRKKNKKHDNTK